MKPTKYQRRQPEYAQYYYARAAKDNERQYEQQQRDKLAQWAKTSGYLGEEGQLGIPSTNPNLQTIPGTGIYDKNFDQDRKEMSLRNRAMLMSGNDALQQQALSQMGSMQDSRNTGVNAIDLEKWKKKNIPTKADTKLEQLDNYRRRLRARGKDTTTVDLAINKEVTRPQGTQLSVDANGNVTMTQGDVSNQLNLGAAGSNEADKQIMLGAKQLNQMYAIGDTYSDEYLGLGGAIGGAIGSAQDYLFGKGELAEFNARKGTFKRNVKQLFNDYKVEITGAAAGEQEMADLRDSILNEQLGPLEFKTAYDQFMEAATTNMILNMKAKNIPEVKIFEQLGFSMATDSDGILRVQMPNGNWEEVNQ